MLGKCSRCGIETKGVSDYGGFVISENRDLCKDCWLEWVEIRSDNYKKEKEFWDRNLVKNSQS